MVLRRLRRGGDLLRIIIIARLRRRVIITRLRRRVIPRLRRRIMGAADLHTDNIL